MTPLVSVVVPVYNAAASLRVTMEAVLAQTHARLDVVAVDDGSTDGSGDVLDEIAAADARVRVIHQANSGVWAARLAGIAAARGEWLAWCDADDVPHPDLVTDLLAAAQASDAQLAVCPYRRVDPAGQLLSVEANAALPAPLRPATAPVEFATINTALWNKLFAMDAVRGSLALGPDLAGAPRIMEDLVLYASFLGGIDRVALTPEPRYDYVVRPDGLMTTLDLADAETVASWLRALRAALPADRTAAVDGLAFMHLGVAALNILAARPAAESRTYARWVRDTLRRDFPDYTARARVLRGVPLRTAVARALFRAGLLSPVLRLIARRGVGRQAQA